MADVKKTTETPAPAEATPLPIYSADGELVQPQVMRRPDRNVIKDSEERIKAEILAIDAKVKVVGDKAKALNKPPASANEQATEARVRIKELKARREALTAQRATLYNARDAAREGLDAKMSELKDLKSQTKFKDTHSIDKEIKKLETQQSTTSMPLAKEKEVIKEIEELKKQRRVMEKHLAVSSDLDGGKAAAAKEGASIKDLSEALTAVKAEMEALNAIAYPEKKTEDKSVFESLMKEKDALRDLRTVKVAESQKLWDDFKESNLKWKLNQDAWTAFTNARDAKEGVDREARKEESAKKRAEELAKKTPYEEEMDLCEYLGNYLATTFLVEAKKEEEVAAAPIAEFNGMQLSASKKRDGDFFIAPAASKKQPKAKDSAPKKAAGTKRGKIVLHMDTLASFGLLKMDPPTTTEQVPEAIAALQSKKAEFKAMPRGQVLSIAEINQKFEVEAEASRGRARPDRGDKPEKFTPAAPGAAGKGAKKATAGGGGGSGKKIDVGSTELFPALGGSKPPAAPAAAKE